MVLARIQIEFETATGVYSIYVIVPATVSEGGMLQVDEVQAIAFAEQVALTCGYGEDDSDDRGAMSYG